ncbi:ankyrin repeat-containing domain protein [Lipomyces japonicus]|uniref:ankyrin repeat-containing domain protein n=1 Tax=Lipomyces japonicus TaxID=56871 RepID=UPI0034CD507B
MQQTVSIRLRQAIIKNNLEIVKRLLRRFPDLLLNTETSNGWTSLHYAAHYGHFEICVYLASIGHDANEISVDIEGYTPLHLASMQNREQTIHFLAQKFPTTLDKATTPVKTVGYTALILASREGHNASASLLLDFGADINKPDAEGSRPIHYASEYGHRMVIRTLIERDADFKAKNNLGWTPLQYASSTATWSYLNAIMTEVEKRQKAEQKKKLLESKLRLERPSRSSSLNTNLELQAVPMTPEEHEKIDNGNNDQLIINVVAAKETETETETEMVRGNGQVKEVDKAVELNTQA